MMTFNLLADSLATSNSYLYTHCKWRHIDFRFRGQVLLREILARRLSLYCFQELDLKDYEGLFKPTMDRAGYASFYIKRTGPQKLDGCALFYRRDQVHAVALKGVEFRHNTFAERENVGIVALLDIKDGPRRRRVCVATTHVLFNPRRGLIKLAQLRYLLDVAKATVAAEDEDVPTIQAFESAFAEPSADEAQIGRDFYQRHQHHTKTHTDASMSSVQEANTQPLVISASYEATASTSLFEPDISARTFQQKVQSTIKLAISDTFGYLPQHFDFKSSYWDKQWKNGSIQARHQTRIIEKDMAGNVPATSEIQDDDCHNGWTTHHGKCQAVCDYMLYGHLRPDSRKKARQELFKFGCTLSKSVLAPPDVLDDQEQHTHEPRFRTKLVPAAILVLPCAMMSSLPHYRGLPNDEFGSDHLSLVTKFRFEDEQIIPNKDFSQAQLDNALKNHHRQWRYNVPELPEPFEFTAVLPKPHRPHARDHHEHDHSHRPHSHRHERESHRGREQGSHRGWDRGGGGGRGRGRGGGRGHDRGNHRGSSARGYGHNRQFHEVEARRTSHDDSSVM
ncbi:RNA exonuclease ngl2 [Actinomortierella ambigua]|nr:RNA exonuclease ngl2 [Actinomortierella ambigua]